MYKCAELIISENIYEFYQQDNKFYALKEGEYIEIPKLFLANEVSSAWDEDSIYLDVEKDNDIYTGVMNIPIYDFVDFVLFQDGKTKEEALNNINKFYRELLDLSEIYEKNVERNRRNFMSKIKKFAFIDKNCKDFGNKRVKDIDYDLVFFEDSDKTFRELAIEYGVPGDARADEPIFGYIDGEKVVFFKHFFFEGEQKEYLDFVKKNKDKIIEHYNLKDFHLYVSIKSYDDFYVDENKYISEKLITEDFDYYIPHTRIADIKI